MDPTQHILALAGNSNKTKRSSTSVTQNLSFPEARKRHALLPSGGYADAKLIWSRLRPRGAACGSPKHRCNSCGGCRCCTRTKQRWNWRFGHHSTHSCRRNTSGNGCGSGRPLFRSHVQHIKKRWWRVLLPFHQTRCGVGVVRPPSRQRLKTPMTTWILCHLGLHPRPGAGTVVALRSVFYTTKSSAINVFL